MDPQLVLLKDSLHVCLNKSLHFLSLYMLPLHFSVDMVLTRCSSPLFLLQL